MTRVDDEVLFITKDLTGFAKWFLGPISISYEGKIVTARKGEFLVKANTPNKNFNKEFGSQWIKARHIVYNRSEEIRGKQVATYTTSRREECK